MQVSRVRLQCPSSHLEDLPLQPEICTHPQIHYRRARCKYPKTFPGYWNPLVTTSPVRWMCLWVVPPKIPYVTKPDNMLRYYSTWNIWASLQRTRTSKDGQNLLLAKWEMSTSQHFAIFWLVYSLFLASWVFECSVTISSCPCRFHLLKKRWQELNVWRVIPSLMDICLHSWKMSRVQVAFRA